MKLRYPAILTAVILLVLIIMGLYSKSLHGDYNDMDTPLEDEFAVSLISDSLLDSQIEFLSKNLDNSNIIVAVECKEKFLFRYACTTQEVEVVKIFKGKELSVGDEIHVARCGSSMFDEEDMKFKGLTPINMGYVNEMIPGKRYLVFLDERLDTYNKERIYIQPSAILAPIFCYEDIETVPHTPIDYMKKTIEYSLVKDDEFFVMSQESCDKIQQFKKEILSKYK